ncbi:hypothetical protein Tco_0210519 [Tanacetum coccineum]
MPPRRFKKKSVKRIVEKRVAKAIEEYEKTRTDSNNAGGSGSANTGGTVAPEMHGCSYKTFTNGKPHSFNGTEGVVGLKPLGSKGWSRGFEICKIVAEVNKVKFAMCTFEGRALTWCKAHHHRVRVLLGVVHVTSLVTRKGSWVELGISCSKRHFATESDMPLVVGIKGHYRVNTQSEDQTMKTKLAYWSTWSGACLRRRRNRSRP